MPRMVRKQVYLEEEQDRKLKRLAGQRRCTEAQLIREAVQQLPEEPNGASALVARLEAAGVLAPRGPMQPELIGVTRDQLEREWDELMAKRKTPLTLSDAVLHERRESPY